MLFAEIDEAGAVVHPGTGKFEISTDVIVVSGVIAKYDRRQAVPKLPPRKKSSTNRYDDKDIYDTLKNKGCNVGKAFKQLKSLEQNEKGNCSRKTEF